MEKNTINAGIKVELIAWLITNYGYICKLRLNSKVWKK